MNNLVKSILVIIVIFSISSFLKYSFTSLECFLMGVSIRLMFEVVYPESKEKIEK